VRDLVRSTSSAYLDSLATVVLLTATVAYLSAFPHDLSPIDESIHLYDAKRLLRGAVMYRDVFNFITPGWMYLMALLFWLFGTDIAVARMAIAMIHAYTMVLIYGVCRDLDVRPGLAWPPALAYLVVCQPAWAVASQHWLSTLFVVAALGLCARHLHDRTRWSFLLGVVIGLLALVQQQRAAITLAGVVLWLVLDLLLDRRYGVRRPIWSLAATLAWMALGIGVTVVPALAILIARAGFYRVWRALVLYPLVDYANGTIPALWGEVIIVTAGKASYTFPRLLKVLPLALMPAVLRLAWAVARGRAPEEAQRLLLLIVFGVSSVVSILYYPDFIHIAFIAPVFLIALAESAEWVVRSMQAPRLVLRASYVLAAATLLLESAVHLQSNLERKRNGYQISRSTAFGRVDFHSGRDARLYDLMKERMRGTWSRYMFCYPLIADLYLMLDAENPSAVGFLFPGRTGPDLVQEALDALAAKRPPYILFIPEWGGEGDPVGSWIKEHYEPTGDDQWHTGWLVYRAKPESGGA
jgi:hypothetical protein